MKELAVAAITYLVAVSAIGLVIGVTFWFVDPNRKN